VILNFCFIKYEAEIILTIFLAKGQSQLDILVKKKGVTTSCRACTSLALKGK